MLAVPAGVNMFGLNRRCPLTCSEICSGSESPGSGSGCSGFGLRVLGAGRKLFGSGAVFPGSSGKPEHLFANLQLGASSVFPEKKANICYFFTIL